MKSNTEISIAPQNGLFVHTVCGRPCQASFCKSNMTPLYVYFTWLFNMMKCTNKRLDWFVYAVDTSLLFRPRLSLCCGEPNSWLVGCPIRSSNSTRFRGELSEISYRLMTVSMLHVSININQNVIYVHYCSYILLFVSSTKQLPGLKKAELFIGLLEVFAKNYTLHGDRFY